MLDALTRLPLRILLGGAHRLLRAAWFVRRPHTFGVHAIALTPSGSIILVKLRYAPGWRLPGGGRKRSEDPYAAALRELSEEIGLERFGAIEAAGEFEDNPHFKRDRASLFLVTDVVYRPAWSWEVEAVMECDPNDLPGDLARPASRWIDRVRSRFPARRNMAAVSRPGPGGRQDEKI